MLEILTKTVAQVTIITVFTIAASFTINGLRPDGLSLLYAEQSAVRLEKSGGSISIQDAALLYVADRALFLDARSSMEFEEGHIKNSLSLPVDNFDTAFRQMKDKLHGKEMIVTYCDGESCPLSRELADSLIKAGFKNVQVLQNGWTLWKNEKLPTEISTTATNR
jgi:rhodanese-related sulfurtransferase